MTDLAVGLVQIGAVPGAVGQNLDRSCASAKRAFSDGAQLVVLPELVVSGYSFPDRTAISKVAEPIPGPTTQQWSAICRSTGGWICGGIAEAHDGRIFDSAVLVGSDGVLLRYRKLHLFAAEKKLFDPGDEGLPIFEAPFGRFGALVCYDLRFPEVTRILALRGVDLIGVPTAWVRGFNSEGLDDRGLSPQAYNMKVMANLNQVFICAASQVGRYGSLTFLGGSLIADPVGTTIVGPMSGTEDEIQIATLDMSLVSQARCRGEGIDPRVDRRGDLYSINYEGQDY